MTSTPTQMPVTTESHFAPCGRAVILFGRDVSVLDSEADAVDAACELNRIFAGVKSVDLYSDFFVGA